MRTDAFILVTFFTFSFSPMHAQHEWDNINLASVDAKILENLSPEKSVDLLIIQTFDVKEGKISVYLPPLSSGVILSGTVYLETNGRSAKETAANLLALQNYQLIFQYFFTTALMMT